MAVACASRFACLKLEDDDITENITSKTAASNQGFTQVVKNKASNSKSGGGAAETKTKPKKKKKASNDISELQNLAFGTGTTKTKGKGGNQASGGPRPTSQKQWEEWKKKDTEFVSETYEQDLQQALLLSKIDYEEKKDVYDAIQKETEHTTKNGQNQKKKKKNNQKKEKGTMSLDEFQSLLPSQIDSGNFSKGKADALDDFDIQEKCVPVDETDFFDKIEEDAEKIINKEQRQESLKKSEPVSESARSLQFQDELQKKDAEISLLTENVTKLKEELKIVKTRNKKLYGILGTGEMREKAEIIVQIEQLTSVKDELTEQLHEFHAALEQERSKVHALQTELKKCQSNKKERRDSK